MVRKHSRKKVRTRRSRRGGRSRQTAGGRSQAGGGGVMQSMVGGFRGIVGAGPRRAKKKASGVEWTLTLLLVAVLVGMFVYRVLGD